MQIHWFLKSLVTAAITSIIVIGFMVLFISTTVNSIRQEVVEHFTPKIEQTVDKVKGYADPVKQSLCEKSSKGDNNSSSHEAWKTFYDKFCK